MRTEIVFGLFLAASLTAAAEPALGAGKEIPQRDEIDSKYKWRLEDIYADNDAWEADFKKLEGMIPRLETYRGRLADGDVLLEAFRYNDDVQKILGKLFSYASMRHDEDTRVDVYTSMRDRIRTLNVRVNEATSFMSPEVLAIPRDALWAAVKKTDGLELYHQFLDDLIRGQEHTLGAEMEGLLASAGDVTGTFGSVFGAFHNADVSYGTMKDEDGNDVELTKGRYRRFQESRDRRVREESWKLFYQAYDAVGNTLANNIAGSVKSHIFYAKARNYPSALAASVDRNAIPVEVYRNLIDTVSDNLEPLHRYVALRKKLLGVDELQVWDMSAPLVESPEENIPFEEAMELVTAGVEPLGREYVEPFKAAFAEGWIDVYETEGKRGGAYSWGSYATKPYLLLNYNGTLDAAFTLTHEMGHSMHSYLTRANQPYVYGDYSIFIAEVASTTNEALLIEKMLRETQGRKERMRLLNHYLEQIRGTFFTQVMFAEVELRMHEMAENGEPLTQDSLDRMYTEVYKKYFGPSINVAELNGATWSRIPHFYYNFYVYQYATSYAAATSLAKKILEEGDPAVEGYLDFLKAGSSDYPLEVLKRAGVDMTRPEPIVDTIETFARILDQMEDLLASNE